MKCIKCLVFPERCARPDGYTVKRRMTGSKSLLRARHQRPKGNWDILQELTFYLHRRIIAWRIISNFFLNTCYVPGTVPDAWVSSESKTQALPLHRCPHTIANIIQETPHIRQFRAVTGEEGGLGLHVFFISKFMQIWHSPLQPSKVHFKIVTYFLIIQGYVLCLLFTNFFKNSCDLGMLSMLTIVHKMIPSALSYATGMRKPSLKVPGS